MYSSLLKISLINVSALTLMMLGGCKSLDKLTHIGDNPPLTRIQNPVAVPQYQPVTMPMPTPQAPTQRVNSLWQTGARGFFKDQRASRIGDIMTVLVTIEDKADIQNNTKVSRQTHEKVGINNFMGLEQNLKNFMPKGINPSDLINMSSNPDHEGAASVSRKETINVKLAASIIQILPNGNFVISGRQEFRVNYDVRELIVEGIVRAEDITSANTISYEKIAEARISYGGRGFLDDQQRPRWGKEVLDVIMPM